MVPVPQSISTFWLFSWISTEQALRLSDGTQVPDPSMVMVVDSINPHNGPWRHANTGAAGRICRLFYGFTDGFLLVWALLRPVS